ncbi:hypothetical protein PWT90_05170 [Aphanocladium album]|nr:hypothetical protein PWT90_05170 [Aphanocladium album]
MENLEFHLFGELPPELRARIWHQTVEPRIVPVTCWVGNRRAEAVSQQVSGELWDKALENYRHSVQNNPACKTKLPLELYARAPNKPAVLDVCKEARSLKLYEKMILTPGSSASYAWVNYDVDIIYLEDHEEPYTRFQNCGHLVRRLRIYADLEQEYWSRNQSYGLKVTFNQLAECFVIMDEDTRIWDWRLYDHQRWFSCPPAKIHLIHLDNDEQMTWDELQRMPADKLAIWVQSSPRRDTSSDEDSD